jgi:glycosyltransferase involved in cell wall biosynthesis
MKITLAMLTYNSGKYIPESIGNMLPYVDEVVVTVDTRTTDDTRSILDKWINDGYKIRWKEYLWKHNYSEAKNELIRMIVPIGRDSWMLVWDDDEKIADKDCEKFVNYIRSINSDYTIGGLMVPRKNHYPLWTCDDEDHLKYLYPDRHMIAVRRLDGLGYDSIVHEGACNSVLQRGYKIINYDEISAHHHAWRGDRVNNEYGKHYYYQALSALGNDWDGNVNNVKDANIKKWLEWEYKG